MATERGGRSGLARLADIYLTVQFLRFLAVGGVALVLHWLARFGFSLFLPFWQAVIYAYAVGIAVAYVLNRIFVFPGSSGGVRSEVIAFVVVNVMAFPFVWGFSVVFGEVLFPRIMPVQIALAAGHGVAICIPVFVNFALHKFWTFRTTHLREN